MSEQETPPKINTKPRLSRFIAPAFVWAYRVLMICLLVGFFVGVVFWGRVVPAPAWVHEQIENRLSAEFEGVDIKFDEVGIKLEKNFQATAVVRNLALTNDTGKSIFGLAQVDMNFAVRPLFRGEVKPNSFLLSGAYATLLRDKDGRYALRGGDELSAPAQQAQSLPKLIEQMDRVFASDTLIRFENAEIQALTMRYEDEINERVWVVDGARLRLERDNDDLELSADFALLNGGADVATLEANYKSKIGESQAEFGVNIENVSSQDIALQSPGLAWLSLLEAPISGAFRSGVDESGAFQPLNATLQMDQGVIKVSQESEPIPFQKARSYFTYAPNEQKLTFDELSIDSRWVSGLIEGEATLNGLNQGRLDSFVGQFKMSETQMNPNDVFDKPIFIQQADLDFKMKLDPFQFEIGQLTIDDGTHFFNFDGKITAKDQGWVYAADGTLDSITPARLLDYWPQNLVPPTRKWVVENIQEGQLKDVDFSIRGAADKKPDIFLGFNFKEAKLRYLKNMPNLENATGHASLYQNRFVAQLEQGRVRAPQGGDVALAGTSFTIFDVRKKGAIQSQVQLKTKSSAIAVLSLLNQPNLEVMDKAGLPVNLSEGRANLVTELNVPLRKGITFADVRYSSKGVLTDLRSTKLVPNRKLTAKKMQIEATQEAVKIWGDGQIDDISFKAQWQQKMGKKYAGLSRIDGEILLSQTLNKNFGLGLPDNALKGKAWADFALSLKRGERTELRLKSNLAGLGWRIPQLGWRKSEKSKGKLALRAVLGAQPYVEDLQFEASGLSAQGSITTHANGGLKQAVFKRLRVDKWLDSSVTLSKKSSNGPLNISLKGGKIDLRHMNVESSAQGAASTQSGPLSIDVDRLQITNDISLRKMRGEFSTKGGLRGDFSGQVNGKTAITGHVKPHNGRSAVTVHAKNAGGVFASVGILDQARGGELTLVLEPVGNSESYNGRLRVKNTRVKDAPAMAALLNALSIVGLLEQLNGSGIHFNQIDADFHMSPNKLTLLQASAVGPSMGISMDGYYDIPKGRLDMQGVISPIYLVNGIGRIFTRKGEGLLGFNYKLQGTSKSPDVSVNPLSVFTPGMFRKVFQRPVPSRPSN